MFKLMGILFLIWVGCRAAQAVIVAFTLAKNGRFDNPGSNLKELGHVLMGSYKLDYTKDNLEDKKNKHK